MTLKAKIHYKSHLWYCVTVDIVRQTALFMLMSVVKAILLHFYRKLMFKGSSESALQEQLLSLQSNRHVLGGREPKEHL